MKKKAIRYGRDSLDRAWKPEFKWFKTREIIHWLTLIEINDAHFRDLLVFYKMHPEFKVRILHVHTGCHVTDGSLGLPNNAFARNDLEAMASARIKGSIETVNCDSTPP